MKRFQKVQSIVTVKGKSLKGALPSSTSFIICAQIVTVNNLIPTHEIIIFLNKSSPPTILQERVITDLKEGSAILEQQLRLMNDKYIEL